MAYYLDLFSPETYQAFQNSKQDISGFRHRHRFAADRIKRGDKLVCYMTRISRWFGILEVLDGPFRDSTPIFAPENDPFIIRFKIRVHSWLKPEKAVPIKDPKIWSSLSLVRDYDPNTVQWTGKIRSSLIQLSEEDGVFLTRLLAQQSSNGHEYPLDESDLAKYSTHSVRRVDKTVAVTVPTDRTDDNSPEKADQDEPPRESIQIQALLAEIGSQMGMRVWIPRSDRSGVLSEWKDSEKVLLDRLPLNYDDATLKTIEQIDVLWLRGRSIIRAFEVEHTTSIYSGILRMADLLALQPNMDISLHIVAPAARREKVFQEIRRPVFSLLERNPLAESCTFLSYDALHELASEKHLSHLSDSVVDEYAEEAE